MMLQYLIVQLDAASPSFCHYSNGGSSGLMPVETLRKAIFFAMTENLIVQFLVPDAPLPAQYEALMRKVEHSIIARQGVRADADVEIVEGIPDGEPTGWRTDGVYIVRTSKDELYSRCTQLARLILCSLRVNVVLTDVERFTDGDYPRYEQALAQMADVVAGSMKRGTPLPQSNILTDRLMLGDMNNCNAGVSSVTLMPNGKFYVCPAFCIDGGYDLSQGDQSIGSLDEGLDIPNPQLYDIKHAPICRRCDAWQCRRCVWLNQRLTNDVNTPSHQQCVISHLERRQSKLLGQRLQVKPEWPIPDLHYDDPFAIATQWK